MLNQFGLIGSELVAVAAMAATGQPVARLKRGMQPEVKAERAWLGHGRSSGKAAPDGPMFPLLRFDLL